MTLLTVDDLRAFPEFASPTLTDDWLQTLLDANEGAIERELGGPVGAVEEVIEGTGLGWITLRRRAATLTSITVVDGWDPTVTTALAADDYRVAFDRRSIHRLGTGTNASAGWPLSPGYTTVVYEAEDDEADRKRVQKLLCALDVNAAPGATQEQIGAWLEAHQQSSVWNLAAERAAILSTLWSAGEIDFA